MYNRYVPEGRGGHRRIVVPDPPSSPSPPEFCAGGPGRGVGMSNGGRGGCIGRNGSGQGGGRYSTQTPVPSDNIFSQLLGKWKLDTIDSGDWLLLAILFLLYREGEDTEILIALGLLLIL